MRTLLTSLAFLCLAPQVARAQLACCSRITTIDQRTGVVSATASPSGTTFQFQVKDRALLTRLKANQQVFADFAARTVGTSAQSVCCAMLGAASPPASPPAPAPAPAAGPVTGRPTPVPSPATTPATAQGTGRTTPATSSGTTLAGTAMGGAVTVANPVANRISLNLPTIAYGTPFTRPAPGIFAIPRFEQRTRTAVLNGRNVSTTVLTLRGRKAIEQAPGLPDGARRLLLMHVRTIPKGQSDHYIVNLPLAQQWIAAHPVPAYVKVEQSSGSDCENFYDSFDCAGQAVSNEWERAWEKATEAWEDATQRLEDELQVPECFTEKRLTLADIPVTFSITPSMTVNLQQNGTRGSATATVSGTATLGVPMQSDMRAQLDLFYIPCMPFVVRPRSMSGDGILTVGEEISATVTATGKFDKTFTIPPSGGPVIPIQVFPIIVGGVPIAEVDISAYIEGNIQVIAEGKAEGTFQIRNSHPTRFSFSCNGSGCGARSNAVPVPTTASQGAQLEGKVTVKPAIYTALQLNFNYEMLSARAGPQPYLLGIASGCAAVAATQTSGGPSTSAENHVLTADLDWGAELRAEALVMRKLVAEPYVTSIMNEKHLWYRDLAPGGSNALAALVDPKGPAQAGKRAVHRVTMPSCYPYTDKVKVDVAWTGSAVPVPNGSCQWQAGKGTCSVDPSKPLDIELTWTAPGTYALTVTSVGDAHGRSFTPARPTQVAVVVAPAS